MAQNGAGDSNESIDHLNDLNGSNQSDEVNANDKVSLQIIRQCNSLIYV